jgi:putative peptidoglycan lipid II flippase
MGVVLLPEIAAREAEGDADGRHRTVSAALALGLLLAIPAATALAVLAEPIVAVLFERGKFGAVDRARTAAALAAFAVGLPGAVVAKVLSQVYFARQNPGKPLMVGLVSIGMAIAAGLLLSASEPATGAALAASLAFWTQSLTLAALLWRDGLWRPDGPLLRTLAISIAAAVIMAAAVFALGADLHDDLVGKVADWRAFALLIGLCTAGLAVYAACAWAFGLRSGVWSRTGQGTVQR